MQQIDDPFEIFLNHCGGLMQRVGVVAKANILAHHDQLVSLGSWNIAGSLSGLEIKKIQIRDCLKNSQIELNLLGFYSPLLAAFKKHCNEICDFGQFILIPRQLAAG